MSGSDEDGSYDLDGSDDFMSEDDAYANPFGRNLTSRPARRLLYSSRPASALAHAYPPSFFDDGLAVVADKEVCGVAASLDLSR